MRHSPKVRAPPTGDPAQKAGTMVPAAPVAQWIEQRFPKPRALVRFRPGASLDSSENDLFAGYFLETSVSAAVRSDPLVASRTVARTVARRRGINATL